MGKPKIMPISEVAFINNRNLKETFSAEWKVKQTDNVIRMLVGKIKKLNPPYRIQVTVMEFDEQ